MSPARLALLLALLPLATRSLRAQQPAKPSTSSTGWTEEVPQTFGDDTPTIHATARLVVLDVVVTGDDGKPIKGLKPSDFSLIEDGVRQKLSGFNEYDASTDSPIPPEQPLPPNTFAVHPPLPESVTKTIIVLDQLHYPNYPYVRGDIYAFLKTVPPGNPITLIRLDWQGLHLVQNFTTDPELLRSVVASRSMLPPLPSLECPVRYHGVANPYGRLARYIAGIPGRINLAWITDEGGPGNSIQENYPDLSRLMRNLNGSTDVLRLSRVVPYLIKAGGSVGGILQPLSAPELVGESPIPNSHADKPLDCPIMPAAMGSIFANQDLIDMAAAGGGRAMFGGPRQALTQIVGSGSDYYTLSYVPSNPNWNGKFRNIKINIANLPETPFKLSTLLLGWTEPPGPKIVYRPGYYARSHPDPNTGSPTFGPDTQPGSALDPARKLISVSPHGNPGVAPPHRVTPMEAAMGFGVASPDQVQFTIAVTPAATVEAPSSTPAKDNFLAAQYREGPYRDYHLHFWVDPQRLKFVPTAAGVYRDDLQFVTIVYRDDGFAANTLSTTSHIEASADDVASILSSGFTFDQTIAVPIVQATVAGGFYLRTGVLETSTGHIGALEVPTGQIKLPPPPTVAASATPGP